jgi:hypothetical protein
MNLFKNLLKDFRAGIRYHYPLCCVLRFCWDILVGRRPARYRAVFAEYDFVSCMIFHRNELNINYWRHTNGSRLRAL